MIKSGYGLINESRQVYVSSLRQGDEFIDDGEKYVFLDKKSTRNYYEVTVKDSKGKIITISYDFKEKVSTPESESAPPTPSVSEVDRFRNETKLGLRPYDKDRNLYVENTGKSYKVIKNKVDAYNKKHGTRIYCYDDSMKDATFIKF